jgi:hypothetical protein
LLGRADFPDLGAIHASIEVWTNLSKRFEQEKDAESKERQKYPIHDDWKTLDTLFFQMSNLNALFNRISKALFPDSGDTKTCDADETDENIIDEEMTTSLFPDKGNYKWVINPKQVFFQS